MKKTTFGIAIALSALGAIALTPSAGTLYAAGIGEASNAGNPPPPMLSQPQLPPPPQVPAALPPELAPAPQLGIPAQLPPPAAPKIQTNSVQLPPVADAVPAIAPPAPAPAPALAPAPAPEPAAKLTPPGAPVLAPVAPPAPKAPGNPPKPKNKQAELEEAQNALKRNGAGAPPPPPAMTHPEASPAQAAPAPAAAKKPDVPKAPTAAPPKAAPSTTANKAPAPKKERAIDVTVPLKRQKMENTDHKLPLFRCYCRYADPKAQQAADAALWTAEFKDITVTDEETDETTEVFTAREKKTLVAEQALSDRLEKTLKK